MDKQCLFCAKDLQPDPDDAWCSQRCFEDWWDHCEGDE